MSPRSKVQSPRSVRGGRFRGAGIYHLVIYVPRGRTVKVGALGGIEFAAGYYGYTGSARSGFAARVGRHLGEEKKLRWHVDFLLRRGKVTEVWLKQGCSGECRAHRFMGRRNEGNEAAAGFGSSDCTCRSHLWRYRAKPSVPRGWQVVVP